MKLKLSCPSPLRTGNYKTTTRMFFTSSKLLEAQITELFDYIWADVTALKNLRWQVRGYYEELPIRNNSQLAKKFVFEEDITNRPNLYRACIEQSMDDQLFYIAKTLLTNIFAFYEAWIENSLQLLQIPYAGHLYKHFQYPIDRKHNYIQILQKLQSKGTQEIIDNFYNNYKQANPNYNLNHLENYFKVYRYFKECRNSIIHNGGQTTQLVYDAHIAMANLSNMDLDVKEVPQPMASAVGDPIILSLRGVVGFTQIILKIVSTFDVEFIKCAGAEQYLCNRIKECMTVIPYPTCKLSKDKTCREVSNLVRQGRFISPSNPSILYNILKRNRIMR